LKTLEDCEEVYDEGKKIREVSEMGLVEMKVDFPGGISL